MFLQELIQQTLLPEREKKAFEIFLYNSKYQHAFEQPGTSFNVTDSLFERLEEFVSRLYGQSCSNIKQVRYRLFCTKSFKEHRLAHRVFHGMRYYSTRLEQIIIQQLTEGR